MVAFLLTVALAFVGLPSTTLAGVQDAPFPTFSDGKASQLALLIPTAIKINGLPASSSIAKALAQIRCVTPSDSVRRNPNPLRRIG